MLLHRLVVQSELNSAGRLRWKTHSQGQRCELPLSETPAFL